MIHRIEKKIKFTMTKSAQQENPDLLEKRTKILKVKILDGMVTVNKLQTLNETKNCKNL